MTDSKFVLIGVGVAGLGLLYLIKKPGAATALGEEFGGAVVDAVGGAATGALDGISEGVGIPTTKETITDVQECRRYMDANGVWEASFKCGAPAFIGALTA